MVARKTKKGYVDWAAEEERRRLREVEEFRGEWDWQRVFSKWKSRLEDFALDPLSLFVEVSVHDPAHPTDRSPELSWWPTQGIRERQEYVQQHFLEWPGTRGPIHVDNQRKGELDTLSHLYEFKSNAESVAAILIAASLFARLRSSRREFPRDQWPPFRCVEALEAMAYQQWQGEPFWIPWADTCTVVLPYSSHDWDYTITDLRALVRYLAEEHVAVFSQCRPVVVNFSVECDPFVERRFRDKKRAEAERAHQWEVHWKEQQAKREQERIDRLKVHPRCEEWDRLSPQELERLVWSMPTTKIAEQFGVSDSAIGKRCRGAGIKKPPPGFWARVEAGKIPHPNGTPPYN
jgi:hypothetical protein